jgi:hypothetical protein
MGLTQAPIDPSLYLDLDFLNELSRRTQLLSTVLSTVRYLGIEVDDALAIAEQVDV